MSILRGRDPGARPQMQALWGMGHGHGTHGPAVRWPGRAGLMPSLRQVHGSQDHHRAALVSVPAWLDAGPKKSVCPFCGRVHMTFPLSQGERIGATVLLAIAVAIGIAVIGSVLSNR